MPIDAAHTGDVLGVDLRPDGKVLATASTDTSAKVWDAASGRLLSTHLGHRGGVQAVAFAPTGSAIATAGDDSTVRLWRPIGGRELEAMPAMAGKVHGVAYSPDGSRLAAADDAGMVTIWDSQSGEQVTTFRADPTKVFAVAYGPKGEVVATGGADGIVRAVGPDDGHVARFALRTRPVRCGAWPSPRTARCWRAPAATARSDSGTGRRDARSANAPEGGQRTDQRRRDLPGRLRGGQREQRGRGDGLGYRHRQGAAPARR